MAYLAIKGHATRGNEIIKILEMLGCNNSGACTGSDTNKMYTFDGSVIDYVGLDNRGRNFKIFTLEEFLEKFPYKVGDKVYYDNKVCDVIEMLWNSNLNTISYGVYDGEIKNLTIVEELKPYKEETMEHFKNNEETKMSIPESMKQITEAAENLIAPDDVQGSFIMSEEQLKKQVRRIIFQNDAPAKTELVLGDEFEIKVDGGKTFVVRKQPQYPKTYEECCDVLGIEEDLWFVYEDIDANHINPACISNYRMRRLDLYHNLEKLVICRDAYWKIAGEQMGLGKPWKPDWKNGLNKCCLTVCENRIVKNSLATANAILVFPTEEMRDAFFENFKDLIEECKELL